MNPADERRKLLTIIGFIAILASVGLIVAFTDNDSLGAPTRITGHSIENGARQVCLEEKENACIKDKTGSASLEDCLRRAVVDCENLS